LGHGLNCSMTPDLINGTFELCGSYFIWLHIRQVLKDKKVAGVSVLATGFFSAWGFWNLFYYPHLEQWISFWGGAFLATSNAIWLGLLAKYKREQERNEASDHDR